MMPDSDSRESKKKVANGTTRLTRIYHCEKALDILEEYADAGPLYLHQLWISYTKY